MAEDLIQEFEASAEALVIKFSRTIKVSTITNDKFTLVDVSGTPATIDDPFEDIDLLTDYSSVSRILTLRWAFGAISSNTDYELTISGLKDSADVTIPDEVIEFTTPTLDEDADNDGIIDSIDDFDGTLDSGPLVEITDYSIADPFAGDLVSPDLGDYYVVSTDPVDDQYYLDPDYANGRITVTFLDAPSEDFLTSEYFKVQRKKIQRLPNRWETLTTQISALENDVYIDVPSLDDDSIYYASDNDYYEQGYEYRLIIKSGIYSDAATPTVTLADTTVNWMSGLDPMYLSAEELTSIFPDAPLTEIAKEIFIASSDAKKIIGLGDDVTEADLPISVIDYVRAAAACKLSKVYEADDEGIISNFRLGDLQVITQPINKAKINRGNATTWCELAYALRNEMLGSATGIRAVVKSSALANPIPVRRLRSL